MILNYPDNTIEISSYTNGFALNVIKVNLFIDLNQVVITDVKAQKDDILG